MDNLTMKCLVRRCAVRSDRGETVATNVIQSATNVVQSVDKGVSRWMSQECGPVKSGVVGR